MSVHGKESDNGVVEFQFYRPDAQTKWQSFRKAIYDPSSKKFLGRTAKSWGQLLLFYAIFYLVLGALFFVCMRVLLTTLDKQEPTWTLQRSLIGINPGLGYRPMPETTEEGSLIWYNTTDPESGEKWAKLIDTFLEPYKNQTGSNYVTCDVDLPPEGKVCTVPIDGNALGNCNAKERYGYNSPSPCVFLKLNRIFNWNPNYYTSVIPEMPIDLRKHIESYTSPVEREQIWVTCNGVDGVDKENILGMNYSPQGFARYYYPFKNDRNYLSPIVAVRLNVKPNVLVSVECRAWAKNIQYQGGSLNREGSVTFEVQVDMEN